MKAVLQKIIQQQDLSSEEMTKAMHTILDGHADPAQIGAFLMGMTMKGENAEELTAAVLTLRSYLPELEHPPQNLVDIVGTGGDLSHTFNISTTCAFVVAAAGGKVAKHGNRAVSSHSGSADVLEAAGAVLDLDVPSVFTCIEKIGVGFLFAPAHHKTLLQVQSIRRALGFRTFFNLLGPLTNPLNATHHLIGVFHDRWLLPFAEVLRNCQSHHALIVHSADGLDEISIAAPTQVVELQNDQIQSYTITPEQFGITRQPLQSLHVNNKEESLALMRQVFANEPGPARDIVILNAGAAIYAADITPTLEEGIACAQEALENNAAQKKFSDFIQLTQQLTHD